MYIIFMKAVTKMIQTAMTYIDQIPDKETMLELINTIRTVTEGKVINNIFFNIINLFFI